MNQMISNMKKLVLVSLSMMCFVSFGQRIYNFNYSTGMPIGTYSDYVSEYSWQGFEVGYQKDVGTNLTLGFSYRWQKFYEKKDRATYEFENGAITSNLYTYSFINNLNVTLNYYMDNASRITPYFSLAAGPAFVENRLVIGFIDLDDSSWKIGMSPQVGVIMDINDSFGIDLKCNYNYLPLQYQRFSSIQFVGASIGLVWRDSSF